MAFKSPKQAAWAYATKQPFTHGQQVPQGLPHVTSSITAGVTPMQNLAAQAASKSPWAKVGKK